MKIRCEFLIAQGRAFCYREKKTILSYNYFWK